LILESFTSVSPLICQDEAVSADIYVEISKFADSMEEPFLKKMLQDLLGIVLKTNGTRNSKNEMIHPKPPCFFLKNMVSSCMCCRVMWVSAHVQKLSTGWAWT